MDSIGGRNLCSLRHSLSTCDSWKRRKRMKMSTNINSCDLSDDFFFFLSLNRCDVIHPLRVWRSCAQSRLRDVRREAARSVSFFCFFFFRPFFRSTFTLHFFFLSPSPELNRVCVAREEKRREKSLREEERRVWGAVRRREVFCGCHGDGGRTTGSVRTDAEAAPRVDGSARSGGYRTVKSTRRRPGCLQETLHFAHWR